MSIIGKLEMYICDVCVYDSSKVCRRPLISLLFIGSY